MSILDQTLDRPYGQQPETRAAAVRYLTRTGNADLAEMLGLGDDPEAPKPYVVVHGRSYCTTCHQRIPSGVCYQPECQRRRLDAKNETVGGAR